MPECLFLTWAVYPDLQTYAVEPTVSDRVEPQLAVRILYLYDPPLEPSSQGVCNHWLLAQL